MTAAGKHSDGRRARAALKDCTGSELHRRHGSPSAAGLQGRRFGFREDEGIPALAGQGESGMGAREAGSVRAVLPLLRERSRILCAFAAPGNVRVRASYTEFGALNRAPFSAKLRFSPLPASHCLRACVCVFLCGCDVKHAHDLR